MEGFHSRNTANQDISGTGLQRSNVKNVCNMFSVKYQNRNSITQSIVSKI